MFNMSVRNIGAKGIELKSWSNCSCADCDSTSCFSKRYNENSCTCDACEGSKTCLFYKNRLITLKKSNETPHTNKVDVCVATESFEREFLYPYNSSRNITKFRKEYPFSFSYLLEAARKSEVHKNKQETEQPTTEFVDTNELDDLTRFEDAESDNVEINNARNLLANTPYPCNGINPSRAKLSAQIMNVSYQDFQNNLSVNKENKINTVDIFKRIKQAYNMCTCKICECLTGLTISAQNDVCDCKPCECAECKKLLTKYPTVKSNREMPIENYKSITYDKIEQRTNCNCKPCDCIKCAASSKISKSCNCEPCQCVDCRSLYGCPRTVVVAPVGQDTEQNVCSCSPCDCFQCGHTYGTISTIRHEMSTGISRHPNCRCETCINDMCNQDGNITCRCDSHSKIMRKPVQKDSNDYDIRNAIINTTSAFKRKMEPNRNDTIAMFAALTNCYSKRRPYSTDANRCSCDECECVICAQKEDIATSLKSSQHYGPLKNISLALNMNQHQVTCKCAPCECEVCSKRVQAVARDRQSENCKCDVCDCLDCLYSGPSSSKKEVLNLTTSRKHCNCKPCECIQCYNEKRNIKEEDSKSTFDFTSDRTQNENIRCYPFKRGKMMRCTKFHNKNTQRDTTITKQLREQFLPENIKAGVDKLVSSNINIADNIKCEQNSKTYNLPPENSTFEGRKIKAQPLKFTFYRDQVQLGLIKGKTNKGKLPDEKMIDDCKYSKSCTSSISSYVTSKTSCSKECDMCECYKTKYIAKLHQVSCDSSGHDSPNYLIKFPKTTVERCINDVMKLNFDCRMDLNQLHRSSVLTGGNAYTNLPSNYDDNANRNISYEINDETCKPIPTVQIFTKETCKNLNSDDTCQCNTCDCEKCLYGQVKLERCRCDCMACKCCGVCESTDRSIMIRKNEETQTINKTEERGVNPDDSTLIRSNFMSREFKDTGKCYMNIKELAVTRDLDYLKLNRVSNSSFFSKPAVEVYSYAWSCGNKSPYAYCKADVADPLHIKTDYETAQKTIFEARAFSLELMEILQKYEKANREFESISEKLQRSHELLFKEKHVIFDTTNINMIDTRNILNFTNEKEKVITVNNIDNKENRTESIELDDKNIVYDVSYTIDKDKKQNQQLNTSGPCKNKELNKDLYKKYSKLIKRAANKVRKDVLDTITPREEKPCNTDLKSNDNNILICDNDKDCVMLDTAHTNRDDIDIKHKTVISPKSSRQIDSVLGWTNIIMAVPSEVQNKTKRNDVPVEAKGKVLEVKGYTDSTRTDKNVYRNPLTCLKTGTLSILPSPDIEDAPTSFENLGFDSVKRATLSRQENKALMILQNEVKKLLDSPLFHSNIKVNNGFLEYPILENNSNSDIQEQEASQTKKKTLSGPDKKVPNLQCSGIESKDCYLTPPSWDRPLEFPSLPDFQRQRVIARAYSTEHALDSEMEMSNVLSSNTSYEALKATFYSIKRVSDHTIIVKWNSPRIQTDVQGYELLVDGRTVQKILNPTCSVAVVTCLPHVDKIILTIRTLTPLRTSPYPATSIVYRPRVK